MAEVQTQTTAGEMTQIFVEFVMMQAQNAALFLGQVPDPRGGQPEINLPLAKMFIDQLAVVRARTRGNLSSDEQRVIDSALEQLQQAFVEVAHALGHPMPEPRSFEDAPSALDAPSSSADSAPASPPAAAEPSKILPPDASSHSAPEENRKRFTKSYGA